MNRRAFLLFQTQVKVDRPPATLKAESLELTGDTPTRFYMRKGAAPSNTVDTITNKQHDAVLFIDADGTPKVRLSDGRIFAMNQV